MLSDGNDRSQSIAVTVGLLRSSGRRSGARRIGSVRRSYSEKRCPPRPRMRMLDGFNEGWIEWMAVV